MKLSVLIVALLLVTAAAATAAPGDSWILPIGDLQGGGWIEHMGAGYGGASAWEGVGMDGVRRVIWKTDGTDMSAATKLYTIEFFVPTDAGALDWQPIESQISGSAGEVFPIDSNIPWAGMYGTNHQYIGTNSAAAGEWATTGPGSHVPESADYNAGANGTMMWLHQGSWLYAKWDYGWSIDHEWSAIKLTEVPEPSTFVALLAGLPLLAIWRRKR